MAVKLVNIGKMKSAKSQLLSSGVISRLLYFTLALLTMILGLISRSSSVSLPEILSALDKRNSIYNVGCIGVRFWISCEWSCLLRCWSWCGFFIG